nr:hypothetical protein [uncultured Mucilaginibacter sp.]
MSNIDSAYLRRRLEDRLAVIFANKTICKYLAIDGYGGELQIIGDYTDNVLVLPQIKLAYQIWLDMYTIDRHSVVGKFHRLYAGLPLLNGDNKKTLIFCALFIHEFAAILAAASGWPD